MGKGKPIAGYLLNTIPFMFSILTTFLQEYTNKKTSTGAGSIQTELSV
jgi:hypothetical protein